jgi:hypothetical protein
MAASKARLANQFVCLPMTFLADETRVTVREVERERDRGRTCNTGHPYNDCIERVS